MVKLICEECSSDNVFNIEASVALGIGHFEQFQCIDCGYIFTLDDANLMVVYDDE